MGSFVVDERFCGPPNVGNGGYVCGRLAACVGSGGAAVEVMLRRPVPLGRELRIETVGEDRVVLRDGETVLAEAKGADVPPGPPPAPPSFDDALEAAKGYAGFARHGFPRCFVCGPARAEGDGLRVFPGPLRDGVVAGPWIPDPSLAAPDGAVRREFLWAALDCPGAFALMGERAGVPMLLGRMTARIENDAVLPGERCVVLAWKIGADGRKLFAGSALFAESDRLRGVARAVWFEIGGAGG